MAQSDPGTINPSTTSGTALAALLTARFAAEDTGHSGSSRPSYAQEGMLYSNDSFSPFHIFLAGSAGDGSDDIDLTALFAPPPGTIRETAKVILDDGWLWADGTAVLRGDYPDLMDAIAPAFTGTTNGTTTISSMSADLRNLGLVGAKVEGSDIPAGATITAITSTTITISAAATGSHSGMALRVFPWGNGNGSTTFNTPNKKGRVGIGRGDMGGTDVALITTSGAGFEGKNLGASGGVQTFQLTTTHMASHSHSASTSGTASTDPGHTHADTFSIAAGGTHSHNLLVKETGAHTGAQTAVQYYTDWNAVGVNTAGLVASGGSHTHTISGSISTGGSHTHTLTISTTIGNTGGDIAHQNTQPSVVCNYLVKT